MDGYSVKEAATVLGVPKRRVWELIARGVLSGAPEGGGGMRVFLQPRPERPSPLSAAREEPPRTNGNSGHAESAGERSPFREILTEFRSLTERYGQALLALGEARGEVAALRSRVELLEARLDLRLPGPRTSSTVAWEMPEYTPPAPPVPEAPEAPEAAESPVEAHIADAALADSFVAAPEAVAESEITLAAEATAPAPIQAPRTPMPDPDEEKGASRRRRVLRSHSAIAGIAEALERAQDPTLADLPGAREAAEALAALHREVEASTDTLESEAPMDEAAAIPEPEGEVPPEPEVEVLPEPELQGEPAAEASFVEPAEASFHEPAAATSAQELVDEEPWVEAPPPGADVEWAAEEEVEAEPVVDAEPLPASAVDTEQTGVEPDATREGDAEADAAPAAASAPSHYTTEVVEPDWFADGDFTWLEAAQAESASIEAADEVESKEPEAKEAVMEPSPTLDTEERELEERELEEHEPIQAAPAAQAIQDAFEAVEPPEPPEPPVAAAEPEFEQVAEAVQDREQTETEPQAAPAAEAVNDASDDVFEVAFDDAFEVAELNAPEAEAAAEPELPEPEPEAAEAAFAPDEREWAHEGSGPAAEAIQDAFEPQEPWPPAAETPAATATSREEPFAPANVAVFAVDQSEPERAGMPDAEDQARPPEARAEARPPEARAEPESTEPPPAPAGTEGLGGLAVQAAAPPAVEPAPRATPRLEGEELMWLGDEFEAAGLEIAAPGWHSQPEAAADASVEPSRIAPQEMTHDAQAHGMSDEDLTQIAQDEGWEADEVEAIRTLLGRPTTAQLSEEPDAPPATQWSSAPSVESPSPPDDIHPMDEARAGAPYPELSEAPYEPPEALYEPEPLPPMEWPTAEPIPPVAPEPPVAEATAEPARSIPIEESIRQSIAARQSERRATAPDPEWLRRRRGPAARAYRRLRRLLPG